MIRFSLQIDGTPVDLFNDESIPLTRQLKDLMNLSTVWTDYTKDFQIPAVYAYPADAKPTLLVT